MRTPLHPQVEWQATLRTLDGTQTLEVSWLLKRDIRMASGVDLVLLGGNSEGWWPYLKPARRTSSFLLFICFVSRETL